MTYETREKGRNTNVFIPESIDKAKKSLNVTWLNLIIRGIKSFSPDAVQKKYDELVQDNTQIRAKLGRYVMQNGELLERLKKLEKKVK